MAERRYIVRRSFRDVVGMLRVGDTPDAQRVSTWPESNIIAMVNMGILEPYVEQVVEKPKKGVRRDRA